MENTLQVEWTRNGSVANRNCGRRTGQEAPSIFSTSKPGQVTPWDGKAKGDSPKPESASCNSTRSGSTAGRDAELTTPWTGFCFLSDSPHFRVLSCSLGGKQLELLLPVHLLAISKSPVHALPATAALGPCQWCLALPLWLWDASAGYLVKDGLAARTQ